MPDRPPETSRMISAAEAIREATEQCLSSDPRVYMMGQGVADPKGVFGTTLGLAQRFGGERVFETPVAENGMTGVAIGSALMGRRPIMVHQRVDFAMLALEQLLNNGAKMHFVTNGEHKVPLVVRLIIGRGWGQGPEHSQVLETVFASAPGLKVIMPSTPYDAKGMLIAAVEDDNPVIILEHRWLHAVIGHVPQEMYRAPLSGQNRMRVGDDVTIVASSFAVLEAMEAADLMAECGVQADLFDLRAVRPLDLTAIFESVRRTGRLIVVDTGWKMFGLGAEIVAQVTEQGFQHLRAPPIRLGLPDYPTPSSRGLVGAFYPSSQGVVEAVGRLSPEWIPRLRPAIDTIQTRRAKLPVDAPNPAFRGPF